MLLNEIPTSRSVLHTAEEAEGYLNSLHDELDRLFEYVRGQDAVMGSQGNEPKAGLENSLSRICSSAASAVGRIRTLNNVIKRKDS